MSMQSFLRGFLSVIQNNALWGLSGATLPLRAWTRLLFVLIAVALSAVCHAEDNGLPFSGSLAVLVGPTTPTTGFTTSCGLLLLLGDDAGRGGCEGGGAEAVGAAGYCEDDDDGLKFEANDLEWLVAGPAAPSSAAVAPASLLLYELERAVGSVLDRVTSGSCCPSLVVRVKSPDSRPNLSCSPNPEGNNKTQKQHYDPSQHGGKHLSESTSLIDWILWLRKSFYHGSFVVKVPNI